MKNKTRGQVTPAQINAANAKFWEGPHARIQAKMAAMTAAQVALIGAINDLIGDDAFHADKASMNALREVVASPMSALRAAISARNTAAAKAPRPRRRTAIKDATVEAMKRARRNGHTLKDFVAAATTGSVPGVQFRDAEATGISRWIVEVDEADGSEKKSWKGLEGWWTEAKAPVLS